MFHSTCLRTRFAEPGIWAHFARTLETTVMRSCYARTVHEALGNLRQWSRADRELIQRALERLYETHGHVRMEELAAHCGLSLRQFERRFKRRMGLAPKVFARLLRFEAARDALLQGQEADAIRFGYQDQAHLIREFSFWSGMTPGAFVERARQRAAQTQRPQRQHTFIALFLV